METKKAEQKGFIGNSKFGKHFYALTLGLAFVLSSGSYFFVSAADLEVQSDLKNAYQTIGRVMITDGGTFSTNPYFDFNYDGNGGAYFGNVPSGTIEKSLGLNALKELVYGTPLSPSSWSDSDWSIVDTGNIYKDVAKPSSTGVGRVSIGSYSGYLTIDVSGVNHPAIYLNNTVKDTAAKIQFANNTSTDVVWTIGSRVQNLRDEFFISVLGKLVPFKISSGGNVGINNLYPTESLDVSGSIAVNFPGTSRIFLGGRNSTIPSVHSTPAGNLSLDTIDNGKLYLNRYVSATTEISGNLNMVNGIIDMGSGDISNANRVTAVAFVLSSDKDFKENIQIIKNPLDKIYALNGYTFDWKKDGRHDVGLIAQEVEKVLPELVQVVDTSGHKGVEYSNMVALLIEGIKELGNKIDGLYNKYLDQQNQIDDLEARIEKLENR